MTAPTPRIIAVDGPAASGKGTLARRLARHFGFAYLDTGLLYRAVGLRLLRAGQDPADEAAAIAAAGTVTPAELGDPALRSEATGQAASAVARIPGVRQALLDLQHRFAVAPADEKGRPTPGAVIDGRDIGTVICPGADVKLFVNASLETRAKRRHKELLDRGEAIIYARVLEDMERRDQQDRNRSVAPMAKAPDAFEIDTTKLDADGAFAAALTFIGSRLD
ncbi:cytidylate kinase [Hypericibacter terrae]|uniref:Cytidylate kinase n=1 Tax=Hypericibacter terrae TaxID=2602015 RepID=A0A5J6MCG0_9PROT|nr:d(CMP) kinase [Hypericibacter terrae]QEX14902.1 cytidylate kinase [Hypericibacter terrae]